MEENVVKEKTWSKKIRGYGIIDLVFFCMIIIFAALIINLFLQENMPVSFFLSDLTPFAYKTGQNIILIQYWIFGSLLIVSFLGHLFSSIVIYRMIFSANKIRAQNSTNAKTTNFYLKEVFYFLVIFLLAIISFAPAFYFSTKESFKNLTIDEHKKYFAKHFRIKTFFWIQSCAMILVPNAVLVFLPMTESILVQLTPYYNRDNVKKFYQLSCNKKNILYLYFDRSDSWRFTEQLEKLDHKHQEAFNDFTFYKNNLSLSDTTVSSVPTLTFGYNADVLNKAKLTSPLKEMKVTSLADPHKEVTFPGSNGTNVSNLSLEKVYQLSLANYVAFWNYLGFGITNVCNLPYYGKETPFLAALNLGPNNSLQMNNEMRNKFGFKNFSGTYTSELQKYNDRKAYYNDIDDAYSLASIKTSMNFIKTGTGVFTALYSQQTHFDFAVKNDYGGYERLFGNSPEHIAHAIHDCLIDLSDLISNLKKNYSEIYKQTMIIINSDHGHSFENHPEECSSTDRAAGFAPVFMVKPFGSQNQPQPTPHVNSDLIATADQLALIRTLVFPNWNPTSKNPDPWDPNNRYVNVHDELLSCYRSSFADSEKLWNRQFTVMQPLDWRYLYWRKRIRPSFTRTFKWDQDQDDKSVFCAKNWGKHEWKV